MSDLAWSDVEAALSLAGLPPLPRTAWLAIDLDRLTANLDAFRNALPAGVRVDPVVKADAYGHGAVPIANALDVAGADGVSVATWDEALELRDGGLRLPILVLYPVPPELAAVAAARDIALTVGAEPLLGRTLAAWARAGVDASRAGGRLQVHLEVETGLGRGGVSTDRAHDAVRRIMATPGVDLVGVWSHLGSPDDADRSGAQTRRFGEVAAVLAADAVRSALPARHLAASGGLLAGSAPAYDAVRPGLSIYGVLPDGLSAGAGRTALAAALRPVLSLRAKPVRVAELPAGTGVSYGSAFVTERPSRIATLPVGYADGYQRLLTNHAQALVRGRRVPLVGTIAMDAVMVDVTDVPLPDVTVDDEFVLLGEQGDGTVSAAELARSGTTISWEVLSGMSRRLPRVYYAAARPVGLRTLTEDAGPWRQSVEGPVSPMPASGGSPHEPAPRDRSRPA